MGQIADDVACGFQCSWCGVCFTKFDGYPVLCRDCYRDDPKAAKRCGLMVSQHPEMGDEDEGQG